MGVINPKCQKTRDPISGRSRRCGGGRYTHPDVVVDKWLGLLALVWVGTKVVFL